MGKSKNFNFCFAYVQDKEIQGIILHLTLSQIEPHKREKFKKVILSIQGIIIKWESSKSSGWTDGKSKYLEIKKRVKKGLRDQIVVLEKKKKKQCIESFYYIFYTVSVSIIQLTGSSQPLKLGNSMFGTFSML